MGGRRLGGEGSFRLRSNGRWECRLRAGGVRVSGYGATKRAARRAAEERLGAKADPHGLGVPAGSSLATFLDWWVRVDLSGKAPKTRENYRVYADRYLVPVLGEVPVNKLNATHVRHLLDETASGRLTRQPKQPGPVRRPSPRTVQYVHQTLSSALSAAVRYELVDRNVCKLVKPPQPKKRRQEGMPVADVIALLDQVRGDRLGHLWTLVAALGLRLGEFLALQWADVDLEAGVLWQRRDLQIVGVELRQEYVEAGRLIEGRFTYGDNKDHEDRRIRLPAFVIEALRAQRRAQLEERLAAGTDWHDHDLVFARPDGSHLRPRYVENELARQSEAAGIGRLTPHQMRHACFSLLAYKEVEPRVIMEIAGHSTMAITTDTYLHALPDSLDRAAQTMHDLLGGGQSGAP